MCLGAIRCRLRKSLFGVQEYVYSTLLISGKYLNEDIFNNIHFTSYIQIQIVEKRVKKCNSYYVYLYNCLTKSAIEGATTLFTYITIPHLIERRYIENLVMTEQL